MEYSVPVLDTSTAENGDGGVIGVNTTTGGGALVVPTVDQVGSGSNGARVEQPSGVDLGSQSGDLESVDNGPRPRETVKLDVKNIVQEQKVRVLRLWKTWAQASRADTGNKRPFEQVEQKRETTCGGVKKCKRTFVLGGCLLTGDELVRHIEQVGYRRDKYRDSLTLMLRKLYEHKKNRGIFNIPVDPVLLGIPTYFDIVKKPMDLGTIKNRLESEQYDTPEQFREDVELVFTNAMAFNKPEMYVHFAARLLLKGFKTEYAKFKKEYDAKAQAEEKHSCERCQGDICQLCGLKCIQFQEPVLRCSAPCKARIQRNAPYYRLGGDRGQHWCNKCYTALPERSVGILGQVMVKSELEAMVHNEMFFELWVDCARCSRRLHQICCLYSRIAVPGGATRFVCPICIAEVNGLSPKLLHAKTVTSKNDVEPIPVSEIDPWTSCLPHTEMGRYLENEVRKAVLEAKYSDDIANSFTLRIVSSRDCVTKFEPRIKRWIIAQRKSCGTAYVSEKLEKHFPCRTKTVLLYQRIDGVDVVLFVLYVQEYGANCPLPNRNKVYVSYLDSACFMEPPKLKSKVYQRILESYITWVKARGFESIYIWACPPQRGDAYILYCHPKWQRTPGAERLRKWYGEIVETCKKRGVVLAEDNMYNHHMSNFKPLLNTRASRSSGTKQRPQSLSPIMRPTDKKIKGPVEEVPYFYGDYLPNEMEGMLAMLLRPRTWDEVRTQASCDESIRSWWQVAWGSETKAVLLNSPCASNQVSQGAQRPPVGVPMKLELPAKLGGGQSGVTENVDVIPPVLPPTWKLGPTSNLDTVDLTVGFATPQQRNDWLMRRLAASIKPMTDNFLVLQLNSSQQLPKVTTLNGTVLTQDTTDPDPELPAGIYDTRLAFLDMCKHNNFQFDELRRAKHSSMVLQYYHSLALKQALNKQDNP